MTGEEYQRILAETKDVLGKVKDVLGKAFVCVVLAAIACGGVYGALWVWPDGITNTPLSALTLGMLFRAAASIAIGILSYGIGWMAISALFLKTDTS